MSNFSDQNSAEHLPAVVCADATVLASDRGSAPEDDEAQLAELVQRIKKNIGHSLEVAVKVGRDLTVAKELVGHGNFLPWLHREFEMSPRTARNYMTLASHFEGKMESFSDLRLATARKLVADQNEGARKAIFQRVDGGESLTEEEVKKAIAVGRKAVPGAVLVKDLITEVLARPEELEAADRANIDEALEPVSQPYKLSVAKQADQNADASNKATSEKQRFRTGHTPNHRMMVIGVHRTDGKSQEEQIAGACINLFGKIKGYALCCDCAEIASQLWQNEDYRYQLVKMFEFMKKVQHEVLIIGEMNPRPTSTSAVSPLHTRPN